MIWLAEKPDQQPRPANNSFTKQLPHHALHFWLSQGKGGGGRKQRKPSSELYQP